MFDAALALIALGHLGAEPCKFYAKRCTAFISHLCMGEGGRRGPFPGL